jgi:hypothetical protein
VTPTTRQDINVAELPPTGGDAATDLGILVARTEIVDGPSAFCSAMDAASYDAAAEIFTGDCVTGLRAVGWRGRPR